MSLATALAGFAQTFDIADVHVSPRSNWVKTFGHGWDGGMLAGNRYELRRATMLDLIRTAYKVDADKIFGGPSWLDYDKFEVAAKTKPGTRPETLRLMLQTLLTDRFHLVVKIETQPVPGYVLSKGKGELKLKAADAAGSSGCHEVKPGFDAGKMYSNVECRNVTMEALVATIRGPGGLPVADSTGLDGDWDLDLHIAAGNVAAGATSGGIIDAIERLGLKMEPGKVPQPVLSVESVDEQPSENPPGVAAALPPLPAPKFEVASIRPCEDNVSSLPLSAPGGRYTATCMGLASLIGRAWNLTGAVQPLGVPKWLGSAPNITIVAKAPADVAADFDTLNAMLRGLLADRYGMKVHYEDLPEDADTLVAVKPKLTKADPTGRTGCARQVQPRQGDALPVRVVCRDITMAQFAEQLEAYGFGIRYPVLDGTGIDGAWDFTIDFDSRANFGGRGSGTSGAVDGVAPDPSGSVSFEDAIQRQLGLKLEVHKRLGTVLVIDHLEEKPTEN